MTDRKLICGIVCYQLLDKQHTNKVGLIVCGSDWDPRVSCRQYLFEEI